MEERKDSFFEKVEKIKMPIRILILVGTIVVLAGAFIWLYYIPRTADIADVENKNRKLAKELAEVKKRAKNLEEFERKFERVNLQLEEALKILPDSKEIPSLLTNITRLGRESGLEFMLFNPQAERSQGFYIEIPVSIRVSGTYHRVAQFFDKVGRMDRIVNILNVSMKPEEALSTQLITSCEAVTFQFKPEEEVEAEEKDDKKAKKKGRRKKK
ncbi:MAG: type 4a pilus biogenesis protein PilO [Desulfobacteraceae bacterium]|jgi:type IV pilus assembly protein PilO